MQGHIETDHTNLKQKGEKARVRTPTENKSMFRIRDFQIKTQRSLNEIQHKGVRQSRVKGGLKRQKWPNKRTPNRERCQCSEIRLQIKLKGV